MCYQPLDCTIAVKKTKFSIQLKMEMMGDPRLDDEQ
jgi:hypothetical protein